MDERIRNIIAALEELSNDPAVPKNVKTRIENSINYLKNEEDLSISVNKALNELDEIADDTNMESFTRTQIWNIVSMLEIIR
ncbi:UPF0147 family protein [Candidatus Woesearchaeota archaeon]|nr:UPF0147 family protein [Candidatus Woesearchaeota archaeon]